MEARKTFGIEDMTKSSAMFNNSMRETTINNDNSTFEYIEPSHKTFSTAGLINTLGNVLQRTQRC